MTKALIPLLWFIIFSPTVLGYVYNVKVSKFRVLCPVRVNNNGDHLDYIAPKGQASIKYVGCPSTRVKLMVKKVGTDIDCGTHWTNSNGYLWNKSFSCNYSGSKRSRIDLYMMIYAEGYYHKVTHYYYDFTSDDYKSSGTYRWDNKAKRFYTKNSTSP